MPPLQPLRCSLKAHFCFPLLSGGWGCGCFQAPAPHPLLDLHKASSQHCPSSNFIFNKVCDRLLSLNHVIHQSHLLSFSSSQCQLLFYPLVLSFAAVTPLSRRKCIISGPRHIYFCMISKAIEPVLQGGLFLFFHFCSLLTTAFT